MYPTSYFLANCFCFLLFSALSLLNLSICVVPLFRSFLDHRHFPNVSEATLRRPILFTSLASRQYCEVSMPALRSLLRGKLRVFNEEVFQVQLVFFDEVLHHVARIDRVLRQPLGHLLLVGASGAGKTILTKFVAWMNGLSIFQIKAGRNYNTDSFEQDLRVVMKRAALKDERIAFVIDESNALGPAFLERMNALLASGLHQYD